MTTDGISKQQNLRLAVSELYENKAQAHQRLSLLIKSRNLGSKDAYLKELIDYERKMIAYYEARLAAIDLEPLPAVPDRSIHSEDELRERLATVRPQIEEMLRICEGANKTLEILQREKLLAGKDLETHLLENPL
jgi:hypothetical protein